ncbi:hypothetical protein [Taibaiella soli]|uniref:Uncharacterized protein n=1 Tax=Taibaiella soli TaxID=1649169 RepID=A0A2W2AC44_9BACT|nr:hypothetical protein [Taibaiella soli]PZF72861.1 hypothetical protein DN068_10635 [Taibaiella soli]
MKLRNWKTYTLLLISGLSIFLIRELVQACGGDIDPYDYYPSFFANTVVNEPAYKPFFYTEYLKYYDEWYDVDTTGSLPDGNIQEWKVYANNAPALQDIDSFVYRYSYDQLSNIYYNIDKAKPLTIPVAVQNNSFTKWFQNSKDLEALGYLMYAKRCEPHVTNLASSWDTPRKDLKGAESLIRNGIQLYAAAKNDFIKWRYAFQIVRLTFYNDDFNNTLRLFDQLVGDKKADNLMFAKLLSLKAGALYKLGRRTEAAYLFSRTFDMNDDVKKTSYISYEWSVDSSNGDVLALCKNSHERAVIHVMEGLNAYDDGINYMKSAYAEDPQVRGLDVIMTREINKMEQRYQMDRLLRERNLRDSYWWTTDFYYYEDTHAKDFQEKRQRARLYLDQLSDFSQQLAKDKKVKSRAFWYLSSAYICFMKDDVKGCEKNLTSAKKVGMNTREHDLHDILHILFVIKNSPVINAKTEAKLLPELQWLSDRAANNRAFEGPYQNLLTNVLVTPYLKQKDTAKAVFCLSRRSRPAKDNSSDEFYLDMPGTVMDNMSVEGLQQIEAFYQKKDKTPYEAWLVKNTPYNMGVFQELEGTKYIRRYQFDQAASVLKKVPSSKLFDVPNTFVAYITDQLETEANDSSKLYNKFSFATKMAALQQQLKTNPKDAKAAFEYASGLYNMSYYGKAHNLYVYYRGTSDGNAYYETKERKAFTGAEREFYGVYTAEQYFMEAYANSENAEFKAKCLWMAAKCWQKRCPDPGAKDYGSNAPDPYYVYSLSSPYFKRLKDSYSKTKFYKEAASTCNYLKDYIKH